MSDDEVPMEERRIITEEDIDICMLNPIKHELRPEIIEHIYSSGNSDVWYCDNCKAHGDKWLLMVHLCPKVYQFHYNSKTTQKKNKKEQSEDKDQLKL